LQDEGSLVGLGLLGIYLWVIVWGEREEANYCLLFPFAASGSVSNMVGIGF
jgi:hypothetical protein